MTNVLLEIFLCNVRSVTRNTSLFMFSVSHMMSLNVDMKTIRLWNCDGSPSREAIFGEIFHSIPRISVNGVQNYELW